MNTHGVAALAMAMSLVAGSASAGWCNPKQPKVEVCLKITTKKQVVWKVLELPGFAAGILKQLGAVLASEWYPDADKDGYGAAGPVQKCPVAGHVQNDDDCNDANWSVNPGSAEVCGDGVDQNCSGGADEGCATCACFTGAELDAAHADWQAEQWPSGSVQCLDESTADKNYLTIDLYGERYGNDAAWESSSYYALEDSGYGETFCTRYHQRQDYDVETSTWIVTDYEDTTIPISGEEHEACVDLIEGWAAAHGLTCE